jgi:hypothetical protein
MLHEAVQAVLINTTHSPPSRLAPLAPSASTHTHTHTHLRTHAFTDVRVSLPKLLVSHFHGYSCNGNLHQNTSFWNLIYMCDTRVHEKKYTRNETLKIALIHVYRLSTLHTHTHTQPTQICTIAEASAAPSSPQTNSSSSALFPSPAPPAPPPLFSSTPPAAPPPLASRPPALFPLFRHL